MALNVNVICPVFSERILNVCFHVFLGRLIHVCTFLLLFFAKIEWLSRLSQTSHAEFVDSVIFSVAIYRLSPQSTHLDCESIRFSLSLRKNELIHRSQTVELTGIQVWCHLECSSSV